MSTILAYYPKVHQNFSLFFRHIITSELLFRVYLLSCNVLEIHSVSGWCVIVVCFEKWYDRRIAVGWAVMMTRDPQYWRWQITNAWKSNCRTYSINTIKTVSAALAIISVVIKFRLMPQFTYLTYDTQIKFKKFISSLNWVRNWCQKWHTIFSRLQIEKTNSVWPLDWVAQMWQMAPC